MAVFKDRNSQEREQSRSMADETEMQLIPGLEGDRTDGDQIKNLGEYIKSNKIYQVKCDPHGYTARTGRGEFCECGREESWSGHQRTDSPGSQSPRLDTSPSPFKLEDHCKKEICKVYGDLSFVGFGRHTRLGPSAKFIRVDAKTNPKYLWEIMKDCWEVPEPKLIISVTGGARCAMKSRLVASFKRGLINAATTTDAWIVTGGTMTGVMEFVGQAVHDHTLLTGDPLVAVGIATWGIVDNKQCLDDETHECDYKKKDLGVVNPVSIAPLDPHHSHFILVDNGVERKYGVEIEFRAQFENHASNNANQDTECYGVPVVSVVLGGGGNTVLTAAEACETGTPIVVVEESGRAADLISLAFNKTRKFRIDNNEGFPDGFDAFVKEKAKIIMETTKEDVLNNTVQNIRRMLKELNMITVFSLADEDTTEMDKAILSAILKAKRSDPACQLGVALAWDCAEIAQNEIFTAGNAASWKNNVHLLDSAMMDALLLDKPAFVQLLLDNGVVLNDFLTQEKLETLCHRIIPDKTRTGIGSPFLKDLLTDDGHRDSVNLQRVGRLIGRLVGGVSKDLYQGDPERDLFLWAVLLNRQELAKHFWKTGKDHIGGALFASCMLRSLSSRANVREEIDLSQEIQANADEFERLAAGVLNECYKLDKIKSHHLLTRVLDTCGKRTVFSLADGGNLMDFMKHEACQSKLNRIWRGNMALYTPAWKIILGLFLPFMVFFIKFTTNGKEHSRLDSHEQRIKDRLNRKNNALKLYTTTLCGSKEYKSKEKTENESKGNGSKENESNEIPFHTALFYYHHTPFVKFCYHAISYVVYLALFSFFVLTDLRPATISIYEYLVWGWSLTLIIDEFRQLFVARSSSRGDAAAYFDSLWNRFDCVIMCFLLLSFILRMSLSGDAFAWARLCYVLTLVLLYLRSMHFFFVEKNIGPKVIMIGRMVTDLVFFLLILVTVIFGYGVARVALLYPNSTPSWNILVQVVSQPFWGIYGELFLDNFEGEVPGCSANVTLYENNPDVPRCPSRSGVAIILHALYMLLTNILLINLLIAMFSYTFERVQVQAEKVWCYNRYGLVFEYFDKPTLAPPLIILSQIWRLLKLFHRCRKPERPMNNYFRRTPAEKAENNALAAFERVGMETHMIQKRITNVGGNDSKSNATQEKFEILASEIKQLKELALSQQRLIETRFSVGETTTNPGNT